MKIPRPLLILFFLITNTLSFAAPRICKISMTDLHNALDVKLGRKLSLTRNNPPQELTGTLIGFRPTGSSATLILEITQNSHAATREEVPISSLSHESFESLFGKHSLTPKHHIERVALSPLVAPRLRVRPSRAPEEHDTEPSMPAIGHAPTIAFESPSNPANPVRTATSPDETRPYRAQSSSSTQMVLIPQALNLEAAKLAIPAILEHLHLPLRFAGDALKNSKTSYAVLGAFVAPHPQHLSSLLQEFYERLETLMEQYPQSNLRPTEQIRTYAYTVALWARRTFFELQPLVQDSQHPLHNLRAANAIFNYTLARIAHLARIPLPSHNLNTPQMEAITLQTPPSSEQTTLRPFSLLGFSAIIHARTFVALQDFALEQRPALSFFYYFQSHDSWQEPPQMPGMQLVSQQNITQFSVASAPWRTIQTFMQSRIRYADVNTMITLPADPFVGPQLEYFLNQN